MRQSPRAPKSPLLDRSSLYFVIFSGIIKAAAGGGLLVILPLFGYGAAAIRTVVFIFESLIQIFFVYPSRRIFVMPGFNPTLHLAVGIGAVIQILSIFVPFLRGLLGLTTLDAQALLIVSGAVFLTWAIAESYSRVALMMKKTNH